MRQLLPDAVFVGFTGTPLLPSDKQSSLETFGPYIGTPYRFDEAVEDGVVLDLRYEARDIDQRISAPDNIDAWFESKTAGLTPVAKATLKQRWGTLQRILSSRDRLEQNAKDIILDMEMKPRLKSGEGNAMLVAGSIPEGPMGGLVHCELRQDQQHRLGRAQHDSLRKRRPAPGAASRAGCGICPARSSGSPTLPRVTPLPAGRTGRPARQVLRGGRASAVWLCARVRTG